MVQTIYGYTLIMKPIENYINEALITKANIKGAAAANNNPQPKSKKELRAIIDDCIEKNGLNCNLNHIDTSKITDMSELFKHLFHFNGEISEWDVSNVSNANDMFKGCNDFDGDLGNWDIRSLEQCKGMFLNCRNFTGKGLEKWAKRMKFILDNRTSEAASMFYNCTSLEAKKLECWKDPKPVIGNFIFEYCETQPSWYRPSSIK